MTLHSLDLLRGTADAACLLRASGMCVCSHRQIEDMVSKHVFIFSLSARILLCSPGWRQIHNPPSAPQVLEEMQAFAFISSYRLSGFELAFDRCHKNITSLSHVCCFCCFLRVNTFRSHGVKSAPNQWEKEPIVTNSSRRKCSSPSTSSIGGG